MAHSRKEEFYNQFIKKLYLISGHSAKPGVIENPMKMVMERNSMLAKIMDDIRKINLEDYTQKERIYLIDTAIKAGNLSVVKALSEKFIEQKLADDIRIPSKNNLEHPYRPVFWLPSIVTRQPGVPKENYEKIEKYLCERFNIPSEIKIGDKVFTRKSYLATVELWKHQKNISFMREDKMSKPRYRRHELLDEIEKGITLKKTKP